MRSVRYGTQTIAYDIVRKPSLRNTYIQVDRNGVIVKANDKVSEDEIEGYVLKKSAWILRYLHAYRAKAEEGELRTGSRLYYLGRSYYVEIIKEERPDIEVKFTHSKFLIKTPPKASQAALHQAIDVFYKERAAGKILPLVEKCSRRMELAPAHVSFRRARRRWGSCSPTNRLSFNYHLMKLPMLCIEYVVIHELAHIRHKNHSAEFWSLVGKYMPDYRKREERLKGFEKKL